MCDNELTWQSINDIYFNNFIRDLSINHNSNISDIIKDYNNKKDLKHKKHKKQKQKNKKELIIENQEKLKEKEKIKLDDEKINYFLQDINKKTIYQNISYLETNNGVNKYKLELLKYYWNESKDMNTILPLYFQIENKTNDIVVTIQSKLKNYNKFLYILKECGNLLPPLNFWEKKKIYFR